MDSNIVLEYVLGLIRHSLTAGGVVLVDKGLTSEADLDTGIGAAITLLGLAWSMYRKWKRSH